MPSILLNDITLPGWLPTVKSGIFKVPPVFVLICVPGGEEIILIFTPFYFEFEPMLRDDFCPAKGVTFSLKFGSAVKKPFA